MFAEQLRRAVEASPRVELAKVASLLWRAYAAGQVSEAQASDLSELIESRRALPAAQKPLPRRIHVGSRPRTPASIERRRRWAASGTLPLALACRFTAAETAVLAVIAAEALKHGRCTLVLDHIAALAGVSRTTVKNALREARALGLIRIEERRGSAGGHAPDGRAIISPRGGARVDQRPKKGGGKRHPPPPQENKKGTPAAPKRGGGKSLPPTHTGE